MATEKEGRTTVYNNITSVKKLEQVNKENLDLENDFLEYLSSIDRSKGTIKQYKANLHVFWCWNLEFNHNKFFVDLSKREITKFQSHAINVWNWSPKRVRTVKATISSLSNYIENILDDEFKDYKPIVRKDAKHYMKACALSLAINSGKRKAELTRFKVSYFDDSTLICNGALYKTPEKMVTKGRGQRGKLLDVYTLAKPFKPYLDLWLQEREKLGITSDWLFPKCIDGKWIDEQIEVSSLDSWARTFSNMLDKPFYWHSIRHYFTTYLLEQNLPETVVQTVQGWSSSEMIHIYDDRSGDSQLEKYFGADGIRQVKQSSLQEL